MASGRRTEGPDPGTLWGATLLLHPGRGGQGPWTLCRDLETHSPGSYAGRTDRLALCLESRAPPGVDDTWHVWDPGPKERLPVML